MPLPADDAVSTTQRGLQLCGIAKQLGRTPVLEEINLSVPAGRLTVLLGPTGVGKTSLIRIISGLMSADRGTVCLDGRDLAGQTPQQRRIGVVFQRPHLFPNMTVAENLRFADRHKTESPGKFSLSDLVDRVGHLGLEKFPDQLSEGQKQQVAVLRAIANNPRAILLDEPFSQLDSVTRSGLRIQLAPVLRTLDIPVLFVTSDQEEALEMGDEIAILLGGRIQQTGPPFEVYNHPANPEVAGFLGVSNVFLARWDGFCIRIGKAQLPAPSVMSTSVARGQMVKLIFRPEDVMLAYEPAFLPTAGYLGRAIVETTYDLGPIQRLVLRLSSVAASSVGGSETSREGLKPVDETFLDGLPVHVTRLKWEAGETPLEPGDRAAIGLRDYRVMPHFPTGPTSA